MSAESRALRDEERRRALIHELHSFADELREMERAHMRDVAKLAGTLADMRGRVAYAVTCLEHAMLSGAKRDVDSVAVEVSSALETLRKALEVGV